jgi:hypothetical protein
VCVCVCVWDGWVDGWKDGWMDGWWGEGGGLFGWVRMLDRDSTYVEEYGFIEREPYYYYYYYYYYYHWGHI